MIDDLCSEVITDGGLEDDLAGDLDLEVDFEDFFEQTLNIGSSYFWEKSFFRLVRKVLRIFGLELNNEFTLT